MTKSIYSNVINLVEKESSKESKKVLDTLNNKNAIKDIITDGYVFWFEENKCPNYVKYYLKQFIKRRLHLSYLKEIQTSRSYTYTVVKQLKK